MRYDTLAPVAASKRKRLICFELSGFIIFVIAATFEPIGSTARAITEDLAVGSRITLDMILDQVHILFDISMRPTCSHSS